MSPIGNWCPRLETRKQENKVCEFPRPETPDWKQSTKIKTKKDGWTVLTRYKKLSAQWDHTILVTSDGYEVLILRADEPAIST